MRRVRIVAPLASRTTQDRLAARKPHDEPGFDRGHRAVDDLDAVSRDLFTAELEEVHGRHAVA
jgi:hypothetical protein